MTDIVDRLRTEADGWSSLGLLVAGKTFAEAADEIERLRAALREIEHLRRTTQEGTLRKQHDPAWKIARAALGMTGRPE